MLSGARASLLVATDLAARGLDIAQLPLVVDYALPLVAEDYVHRVGRTERAGAAGRAISLVTPADRQQLREIQLLVSTPIEELAVAGFDTTASAPEARVRFCPRVLRAGTAQERR